jgi:threo-3-hydroxy-L-aspartate ammonia-lyase
MHEQSSEPTRLVELDDLREAAAVLHGVAVRTPLLRSQALGELVGCEMWLKPEMLQRGGAFKFRGAYNFLSHLDPTVRKRGVLAPSSGNHAQAVALAARLFGVPATAVMPTTVTRAKREGAERLGARIELAGTTTDHRFVRAAEMAAAEGSTVVPSYDDYHIVAGQGTAGLEIIEDLAGVDTVLVPVGGGGLGAGVATAVKLLSPSTRVIGVEPEGAATMTRALEAGAPVLLESTRSLADGLLSVRIGNIPFAHLRRYMDDVVLVDDAALLKGMRFLLDRAKLVAEPSGAATVAALLSGAVRPRGRTVALLSGGNIEWDGLAALLGDG